MYRTGDGFELDCVRAVKPYSNIGGIKKIIAIKLITILTEFIPSNLEICKYHKWTRCCVDCCEILMSWSTEVNWLVTVANERFVKQYFSCLRFCRSI